MFPLQTQSKVRWVCDKIAHFLYDFRVPASELKNEQGNASLKIMLSLLVKELLTVAGLPSQAVADADSIAFDNIFDPKTASICFKCLFQGQQSVWVDQNRRLACESAAIDAAQWLWLQEQTGNSRVTLVARGLNFANNPFLFYSEAAAYKADLQNPEVVFPIYARLAQKQNQIQLIHYPCDKTLKKAHFLLSLVFNDELQTAIHPNCDLFFDGRNVSLLVQALSIWWLGLDIEEDACPASSEELAGIEIHRFAEKFVSYWKCIWLVPCKDLTEKVTLLGQQLYSRSGDLFVSEQASNNIVENLDLFDFPRHCFKDDNFCTLSNLEVLKNRLRQLLEREKTRR